MRTNAEGVYAVGDIASFPIALNKNKKLVNIGHWSMALHHGRKTSHKFFFKTTSSQIIFRYFIGTAALTILGRPRPITETAVPFFWSSMFGKSIRYCGYAPNFDDVIIHGDLDNLKFAAFLCEGDVVQAVVTMNFDPLTIQFSELMRQGKILSKLDIISSPQDWTRVLH